MNKLRIRKGVEYGDWTLEVVDKDGAKVCDIEGVQKITITTDARQHFEAMVTLEFCAGALADLDLVGALLQATGGADEPVIMRVTPGEKVSVAEAAGTE